MTALDTAALRKAHPVREDLAHHDGCLTEHANCALHAACDEVDEMLYLLCHAADRDRDNARLRAENASLRGALTAAANRIESIMETHPDLVLAGDLAYYRAALAPEPAPPATHPHAGTSKAQQEAGDPGHCDPCAEVGHVEAHPSLGCGDVGCDKPHEPAPPAPERWRCKRCWEYITNPGESGHGSHWHSRYSITFGQQWCGPVEPVPHGGES